MEDSPSFSKIDKDDSFSILYSSLNIEKSKNTDELIGIELLLGKLLEIIDKYEAISADLADQLDAMEVKHTEEMASKSSDHKNLLDKLQKVLDTINDQAIALEKENDVLKNTNQTIMSFLKSSQNQVNVFLKRMQVQEPEEVVDIVNVDSDDDDEVADNDTEEEENPPEQEQPREAIQSGVIDVERADAGEQMEHGDTLMIATTQNDAEKENIQPHSTPISKKELANVADPKENISTASTSSIGSAANGLDDTVPVSQKRMVAPILVEKPDGQNVKQDASTSTSKKRHECKYCDETFAKKAIMYQHFIDDHGKKLKKKTNDDPGKMVRIASQKRKHVETVAEETDDSDDDFAEKLKRRGFMIVPNPMHQAMKRQKKNTNKYAYTKKQ